MQLLRAIADAGGAVVNAGAIDALVAILQAAGYCGDSWDLDERAVAFDTLRPVPQQRRALKHWNIGRPLEADETTARAVKSAYRILTC